MRAQRSESHPTVPLDVPPSHEPLSPGRPGDASGSLDVAASLDGWDYEPDRVNVRKIRGDDGRAKLQVRLDLGLLQMELGGRPDGKRPRGFTSLLEYHVDRLNAHRSRFGSELGYLLSPADCRELRDEASMYYHRYLALFVLGEYSAALADTRRNLEAIDFCRAHAAEARDRTAMEAYRPYVLMMHARAGGGLCLREGDFRGALRRVRRGLRDLRRHFRRHGGIQAYRSSAEVRVLRKLEKHLAWQVPQSPRRRLKRELVVAIRREEYERAAMLRDELARLDA